MAKRKGWIIFFAVVGIFVLFTVMFISGLAALLEDQPTVRENTVLKINLNGGVTEKASPNAVGRELEGANVEMYTLQKGLRMAQEDDRIKGVYLNVGGLNAGWAKLLEIRALLQDFKTSEKFVTAFLNSCDEKTLFVALAADDVYIQPHASVVLNGLAAELPFLRRMFDKLGIRPQVVHIGKYKNAGDIFQRKSMSPAHREATQALLNDIYDAFIDAVAVEAQVPRAEFRQRLDGGIYRADELRQLQLVDGLKYETEVTDMLKHRVYAADSTAAEKKSLRTIDIRRYAKIPAEDVGPAKGEQIALIYAVGTIVPGRSSHEPLAGRTMGAESIIKLLKTAEKNSKIKAVVLRVDSPGGSGQASDAIWAAIEKLRKKKPVVISMSDVAASGGYWISMNSDAIVAQPLTITGSIGVLSVLFDLSQVYDKLGVDWATVKKGDQSDFLTDKRPITAKERRLLEELIRDFYQVFVQKAADGRGKSFAEIDAVAQGRVWTGKRALQYGLIDTLGGLQTAVDIAKKKAGLDPDKPARWIVYPQPKSFFESVMEKLTVHAGVPKLAQSPDMTLLQGLPAEARNLLQQLVRFAGLRQGDVMALAPHIPNIE